MELSEAEAKEFTVFLNDTFSWQDSGMTATHVVSNLIAIEDNAPSVLFYELVKIGENIFMSFFHMPEMVSAN